MTADADERLIAALAERYGFSQGAVRALRDAMERGGGRMAQFQHPELGGMGQWQAGGLLMIGQLGNAELQARVGLLAEALRQAAHAQAGERTPPSRPPAALAGLVGLAAPWWPADMGQPAASGGQGDVRYAFFPALRRLAVLAGGALTLYDTLDHQVYGVSQQQGHSASLQFTSQRGMFTVDALPIVERRAQP